MLTKEKILRAPKKNYMDKDQLSFFKTQLNELKKETLKHIKDAKDRLSNPPACSDEVDRAQHEIDSMLFLRIVERESKLLPKIDKALSIFGRSLDSRSTILRKSIESISC